MKLSLVIVSYNTKSLLQACLNSINLQLTPQIEVIVVDNNSSDGSPAMVKNSFPHIQLITNSQNMGYAKANNQGINLVQGQYLLLLNSDTRLQPGALQHLLDFMDHHPQVGIASPKLLHPNGTTQLNGGALPTLSSLLYWALFLDDIPLLGRFLPSYHRTHPSYFNSTHPIGWVSGAAIILRRQTISQIGLLDEKIFMYGEDLDLCFRAHQANWLVYTLAPAEVVHLGQGSGSSSSALLREFQGLIYYFSKHHPATSPTLLKIILQLAASLRLFLFGTILQDHEKATIYRQARQLD